jgi:pimeloyl-ACP methyl ester carboxylesterase
MTNSFANTTTDNSFLASSRTVVSVDGAKINYVSAGSGPPVLVIPGALSMAANYTAFARALAEQFSVHIMERRGRGLSSPQGDDYGMVKECEDVLTLQKETGASFLVGHSFGGLVALEVARNNLALIKIAVYEPGVSIGRSIAMDWIPSYEKNLAEGKYFDAFVEFSLGTGPDRARKMPHWLMKLLMPLFLKSKERQQMLDLLPQNLLEHREVARLDSSYEHYREVAAEVLLMYGGKTHIEWVNMAVMHLSSVLPHSRMKEFPKLDHFGLDKRAPRDVARTVGDYFRD